MVASGNRINGIECEAMSGYDQRICEAHADWMNKLEARVKKVENRFLVMMTTLSLNLIGVIVILVLQLTKLKGGP